MVRVFTEPFRQTRVYFILDQCLVSFPLCELGLGPTLLAKPVIDLYPRETKLFLPELSFHVRRIRIVQVFAEPIPHCLFGAFTQPGWHSVSRCLFPEKPRLNPKHICRLLLSECPQPRAISSVDSLLLFFCFGRTAGCCSGDLLQTDHTESRPFSWNRVTHFQDISQRCDKRRLTYSTFVDLDLHRYSGLN